MINIEVKSNCCGCSACSTICGSKAIEMREDEEGFLYPIVDQFKCTQCGLCTKVCPISFRQQTSRINTPQKIYALRSTDDNILFKSSSGGFFYTIATYILKNNGYIVGAEYTKDLTVRHTIINRKEDLHKLLGSKYVQSCMGDTYPEAKKILVSGKQLLFVGTPCQIDGLKHYLRKEYENLITIDLLCHAVPSPLMFRNYLKLAEKNGINGIETLNMRNKKYVGWNPATSWGIKFKDGSYSVNDDRIINWSRLFFSELMSRPSCHDCQYTNFDRVGDFSIGDYWDRSHYHDELYSRKGTSLVFVNNDKASILFAKLQDKFEVFEIKTEESLQQCLREPAPISPQRDEFWALYRDQGFEVCFNKYFSHLQNKLQKKSQRAKFTQAIKDFITPGPWKFPDEVKRTLTYRIIRKLKVWLLSTNNV